VEPTALDVSHVWNEFWKQQIGNGTALALATLAASSGVGLEEEESTRESSGEPIEGGEEEVGEGQSTFFVEENQ
ncbi:hypothetical protein PFISCL1PPCAC_4968, partial [Pristionchus fissidentatus]